MALNPPRHSPLPVRRPVRRQPTLPLQTLLSPIVALQAQSAELVATKRGLADMQYTSAVQVADEYHLAHLCGQPARNAAGDVSDHDDCDYEDQERLDPVNIVPRPPMALPRAWIPRLRTSPTMRRGYHVTPSSPALDRSEQSAENQRPPLYLAPSQAGEKAQKLKPLLLIKAQRARRSTQDCASADEDIAV